MASPSVTGTPATTNDQTAGTTTALNLPASIAAGETLLMLVAAKCTTGEAALPAGWTRFVDVALTTGSGASLHAFWRKADGAEGATVNLTTTTSTRVSAVCYRITGAEDPTVRAPEGTGTTQANTTNPDPPNLAPTGGSKDYLFFAVFASSHGRITSALPTNFATIVEAGPNNGTATNIGIGSGRWATTNSAVDPTTFTTTGTGVEETAAATVAVHPPAAPASAPLLRERRRRSITRLRV